MRSRLISRLIAATFIVCLAGCASEFRSDVSSWHQMPQPNGESFTILAKDPDKQASIEFSHYAEYVSQALQRVGYLPARSGQAADLTVRMDYGISNARSDVRSTGGYLGVGYANGPYGRGYGYGGYGYGHGGAFEGQNIRTYALYSRFFELEIAAPKSSANLYESKVVSEGRNNHLEEVVPKLVDSLFQEFPGPSGITRRVTLEEDKQAAQ